MAAIKGASARKSRISKKSAAKVPRTREGLRKLSQQADKTLGENCGKILTALRDKAEEGVISSAKLLVQLADRDDAVDLETADGKPQESLADWLTTQPEWPGFPKSAQKDSD